MRTSLSLVTLVVLLACGIAAADPIQFSIIYTEVDNGTGTGFDDPVDGAQRWKQQPPSGATF